MRALLVVCGLLALSGCAAPRVYEVTWDESNPPEDKAALAVAMEHWNQCGVVYVQFAESGGVPVSFHEDPIDGDPDIDAQSVGCNHAGLTGHVGSGTHILYRRTTHNTRSLLEHELGHLFGLPHRDDHTHLMYGRRLDHDVSVQGADCANLRAIHGSP